MRKKTALLIVMLSAMLLSGCFSYQDVNRVIFATAVIVDYSDEQFDFYIEAFHSFRSNKTNSEKGEKIVYIGRGITTTDAALALNRESSFKIDYTQNKVFIVTERAARRGMTDFIDFYDRFQQGLIRGHILILEGEPLDLIKMEVKEDEYIGLYLYEALENPQIGISNVQDRINQFFNHRLIGDKISVITMINLGNNQIEDKIEINKSAVLKDDKMIYVLEAKERVAYHLMIDQDQQGAITFSNPQDTQTFVSIELLKTRSKTEIKFDGEHVILTKNIDMKTTLQGIQTPTLLDEKIMAEYEKAAELVVVEQCRELFYKYQELDIDLFNVKGLLEKKYPHVEIEDPLKVTELRIFVNNNLKGSTNVTNFLK